MQFLRGRLERTLLSALMATSLTVGCSSADQDEGGELQSEYEQGQGQEQGQGEYQQGSYEQENYQQGNYQQEYGQDVELGQESAEQGYNSYDESSQQGGDNSYAGYNDAGEENSENSYAQIDNAAGNNANLAGDSYGAEGEGGNYAAANPVDNVANAYANVNGVSEDPAALANSADSVINAEADAGADPYGYSAPAAAAPTAGASGEGFAGSPAAPGLPELGSKLAYIVQRTDTLAKIAQKIYGNMEQWREIATLSNLDNPNRIYPGDVVYYQLTAESLAFASIYENLPRDEVVVSQGMTLADISRQVYGTSADWKLIWRQNDQIDNPDNLVAGQTIYYINEANYTSAIERVENTRIAKSNQDKLNTVKFVQNTHTDTENTGTMDIVKPASVFKFAADHGSSTYDLGYLTI